VTRRVSDWQVSKPINVRLQVSVILGTSTSSDSSRPRHLHSRRVYQHLRRHCTPRRFLPSIPPLLQLTFTRRALYVLTSFAYTLSIELIVVWTELASALFPQNVSNRCKRRIHSEVKATHAIPHPLLLSGKVGLGFHIDIVSRSVGLYFLWG